MTKSNKNATLMPSIEHFNDAANMLNVRDVICVSDTNTPTTQWVNVLSNTGSVVDVSDCTVVVETDGD